ncbi:hypothetical protein ECZU26_46200 [Escherichia coli]|nr:hypothetical protein ECZU22_05060 [Escherichia coli]GHL33795.1 hypothetical protein ECZU26_46200 [Escherichia coli]
MRRTGYAQATIVNVMLRERGAKYRETGFRPGKYRMLRTVVGGEIQLKLASQRHQRVFVCKYRHHRAACALLH